MKVIKIVEMRFGVKTVRLDAHSRIAYTVSI